MSLRERAKRKYFLIKKSKQNKKWEIFDHIIVTERETKTRVERERERERERPVEESRTWRAMTWSPGRATLTRAHVSNSLLWLSSFTPTTTVLFPSPVELPGSASSTILALSLSLSLPLEAGEEGQGNGLLGTLRREKTEDRRLSLSVSLSTAKKSEGERKKKEEMLVILTLTLPRVAYGSYASIFFRNRWLWGALVYFLILSSYAFSRPFWNFFV